MNYPLVKPKDQPFKQGLEAIGRKKTTILFTSLSWLCRALLTKRKKWWWLERTWVHSVQGGKKKKATMVWVSFPSHKTSNFSDGWEKPVSGRKMEQKVTLFKWLHRWKVLRTAWSRRQHDPNRPSEKPPGQPQKHNPAHNTQNTGYS